MKPPRLLRQTKSDGNLCYRDPQELCTHTTMTRMVDPHGILRCESCDKRPEFGWLYVCTQDSDARQAVQDTTTPKSATALTKRQPLSPWIIKAIEDGHYTKDEVATILQQRAQVLTAIYNQHRKIQARKHGYISHRLFSLPGFFLRRLPHTLRFTRVSKDDLELKETHCHSKLCHACHPLGLDLAWLSLNRVCSGEAPKTVLPIRGIQDIPAAELTRVQPYDQSYRARFSHPLHRLRLGCHSSEFGGDSGYEGDYEDTVASSRISIKRKTVKAGKESRRDIFFEKRRGHKWRNPLQSRAATTSIKANPGQLYAQGTNMAFLMLNDKEELRMDWEHELSDH